MSMASPVDSTLKGVIWTKTLKEQVRTYPKLIGEESADVVVVGAGYCGLNAALHAARNGSRVILLEAGVVGNGASGRNGGYNVPHFPGGVTPSAVEGHLGPRKGRDLAELVVTGAEAVFRQAEEFQIGCSSVQKGWMQPAHSETSLKNVRRVYEEWKAFGVNVTWHSAEEVADLLGAKGYIAGWSNKTGGTVNPYGLAIGLGRAASQLGVAIFENSPVDGYEEEANGTVVKVGSARVKAKVVIFATNAYTGNFLKATQRSAIPVNLYHIATKPLSEEQLGKILKTKLCFTDLRRSGGFGRLDPAGRFVSGGAVFAFGNKERYGESHARTRTGLLFPQLASSGIEFESYWEGLCAITDSYLPHVMRLGKNVFSVSGFSTRGVNLAQNLGRVIGEFAAGKRTLDDVPVEVIEGRRDVPFWPLKVRAARLIFPFYQAKDRLGLS